MDQAQRLRQLIEIKKNELNRNKFKVITVSSGKGGVGKTSFVVNLSTALAKRGLKVGILDADFGMANVDIMFGCMAKHSIFDVINNNKNLSEIIVKTEDGVEIIPGGTGLKRIFNIDDEKKHILVQKFEQLSYIDILLIDTGAGASDNVLKFIEIADEVIVITNPEPTALTDAYSLIKIVSINNINQKINVVINRVKNQSEAEETFQKINFTVKNFLGGELNFLGYIVDDNRVGQAIKRQVPFIKEYPNSEISLCINKIVSNVLGEKTQTKHNSFKEYLTKLFKVVGR